MYQQLEINEFPANLRQHEGILFHKFVDQRAIIFVKQKLLECYLEKNEWNINIFVKSVMCKDKKYA